MTEREKSMIEAYLPHRREEGLNNFDYYVKDDFTGKIYRVHICDICPDSKSDSDRYGVYNEHGKKIKSCSEDGNFTMSRLYDNKQDCREDTHSFFDGWENLRRKQEEEK